MKPLPALAFTLLLVACAGAPDDGGDPFAEMFSGVDPARAQAVAARIADRPFGSEENPVRAHMPPGEHAYMARLRCADGRAPRFERQGSAGTGPYGMILDIYEATCANSTPAQAIIYIDMYHPGHVETRAPEGFTLAPQ